MKYQLIKTIFDGKSTIIARNEQGKKVLLDPPHLNPYFYVKEDVLVPEHSEMLEVISGFEGIKPNIFHKIPVKKIVMTAPQYVKDFRSQFNDHWEADIPYNRRVLIDLGIKSGFNDKFQQVNFQMSPVISYIDIEVMSARLPDIDGGNDPIISISIVSKKLKKNLVLILDLKRYKETFSDRIVVHFIEENILLEKFFQVMNTFFPDIISGWNISFDIGYIKARVKYLQKYGNYSRGFNAKKFFKKFLIFDLMAGYKHLFPSKPSYALKNVVVHDKLVKKKDAKKLAKSIGKLWRARKIKEIAEYNYNDSLFCQMINDENKIIEFYWEYKCFSGVNEMEDTLRNSVIIDTMLLRMVHGELVLPSVNRKNKELKGSYEGATLLPSNAPVPKGMYDSVGIFDMSTYYPSAIEAFNISPEVKLNSKILGVIPRLVKFFRKERQIWDEKLSLLDEKDPLYDSVHARQKSRKFALNAVYGVMGFWLFRLFSTIHAGYVTGKCREGILLIEEVSNALGFLVIYGDTDSVFIKIESLKQALELVKTLNDTLLEKFDPSGTVKLQLESICDPVGFKGVKKCYFYLRTWHKGKHGEKLVVKGFEFVRSDSSKITKKLQENLFKFLIGKEYKKLVPYIRRTIKKIDSNKIKLSDISITKGLQKDFVNYKLIPDYVRGSIYANKYLNQDIVPPCKVKMVYVKKIKGNFKGKPYPKTDVICFTDPDTLPKLVLDTDKIIDRTVKKKAKSLVEIAGSSWKEVEGQSMITDFC